MTQSLEKAGKPNSEGGFMTKILFLFLSLFAVESFAVEVDLLSGTTSETIQLKSDTRVVGIHMETSMEVSCPGTLDLNTKGTFGNYLIEIDNSDNRVIADVRDHVSDSCATEIMEYQMAPGFICLSYGREHGRVYIPVEHLDKNNKEIEITYSKFLRVVKIDQLK